MFAGLSLCFVIGKNIMGNISKCFPLNNPMGLLWAELC